MAKLSSSLIGTSRPPWKRMWFAPRLSRALGSVARFSVAVCFLRKRDSSFRIRGIHAPVARRTTSPLVVCNRHATPPAVSGILLALAGS